MSDIELERFVSDIVEWLDGRESNCALDAAEEGGMTQSEIARRWGVTKAWIQMIEADAIAKVRGAPEARGMFALADGEFTEGGEDE